ncbi:hypothetical protein J6590_072488 [Homalodisca vitripennis]|nr:hypothetical protein J6590_072488 [Homalodisca vitripennis]
MKDVAREGGSLGDAFEFNCLLTAGRLLGLELIPEHFLESVNHRVPPSTYAQKERELLLSKNGIKKKVKIGVRPPESKMDSANIPIHPNTRALARFSPDCRSSLLSKRRCPRYFLTVHFSDDDTVNGSSTLENWPQRKKRGACHFYDQFCRKLPRPRGLLGLNISARAARRGGE